MTLAHRSEGVRREVIDFIERTRRMQIVVVTKAVKGAKRKTGIASLSPAAIAFRTTSVGLAMTRESALRISHRPLRDRCTGAGKSRRSRISIAQATEDSKALGVPTRKEGLLS